MDNNNHKEISKIIENILNQNNCKNSETDYIPVGISNRHIHLSESDLETLYGKGYKLNKLKDLKQPGQYAAKEVVTLAGPKGSISNVRILGPTRKDTQVEISKTDSFSIGIKCPVRESGDIKGSAGICVIGPKGSAILKENVIIAKRHIHINELDAKKFNIKNGELVNIITSGDRKAVFTDVLVRVNNSFELECHLDTDEANACGLAKDANVKIINISI